jgi:hypothetical protein
LSGPPWCALALKFAFVPIFGHIPQAKFAGLCYG